MRPLGTLQGSLMRPNTSAHCPGLGLDRRTNQLQAWIAETIGLHSTDVSQQVRRFQSRIKSGSQAASRARSFTNGYLLSIIVD